jgi:crossover junction endodeoxyribonuclease RusA
MSVEIKFPIEFIVEGTAVSLQSKGRRRAIEQWKSKIREASKVALPEGHFAAEGPLAVTLFYFPAAEMGDVDNIVKYVLDALEKHIYMNDRQIQRLLAQKFEPGNVFQFSSPSAVLIEALNKPKPVLYVRLSNDPFEGLN